MFRQFLDSSAYQIWEDFSSDVLVTAHVCDYLSIPISCDKYLKSDYSIMSRGDHMLRVLCLFICLFYQCQHTFFFFVSHHHCRFGRSPGLPDRCYGLGSNYTRIYLGIRIPGDLLLRSLGFRNLPYHTSVQYSWSPTQIRKWRGKVLVGGDWAP